MTSYRSLAFNSCVWLQTLFSFLLYKTARALRALVGVNSADNPTDPAWIRTLLEKKFHHNLPPPPITTIEKFSQTLPGGGLVGLIYRIELKYTEEEEEEEQHQQQQRDDQQQRATAAPARLYPRSLVVKQGKESFRAHLASTFFQNAREAIFYSTFAPRHLDVFASCIPDVYYSRGSLLTGEFMVVMEDLTGKAVPASHMLGNQCWGPPSPPLPEELTSVGALPIVRTIFGTVAEIHARFWMDESLLRAEFEWMRGVRWRKGGGRLSWEASFDNMRDRWRALQLRDGDGEQKKIFTELQREAIGRLLAGTQWSTWQSENGVLGRGHKKGRKNCFTLAHGDFHAGNVLWTIGKKEDSHQAIIVDWSEVGIGCPFTELAQFMISNTSIDFRRENERGLFNEYYHQIVELGVDSVQFPEEKCWERYKAGGIERWLQLLILLAAAQLPEFALLWFSRQVDSFLLDHYSSIPPCFNTVYCLPLR